MRSDYHQSVLMQLTPSHMPTHSLRSGAVRRQRRIQARYDGFTLIELAVVILLITLLLGGILVPLQAQVEQRRVAETEKLFSEIKEALLGFAVTNGFFPCPAVSATIGAEDRVTSGAGIGTCTGGKREGFLPWVTLGLPKADAWGNLFRYSVSPNFSNSNALFGLTDKGDITIQTRDALGNAVNLTVTTPSPEIPAMVLSHGKNGYGATSDSGTARAVPGTWNNTLDEFQNANNAIVFWSRTRSENTGTSGGEFDDIVVWISPSVLFSRMVAAGRF